MRRPFSSSVKLSVSFSSSSVSSSLNKLLTISSSESYIQDHLYPYATTHLYSLYHNPQKHELSLHTPVFHLCQHLIRRFGYPQLTSVTYSMTFPKCNFVFNSILRLA
uniref:Uncharacterized protein n=1 Tax=Sipha flava TaxID=143950 RepID=A0A2S2Q579_9HEMI